MTLAERGVEKAEEQKAEVKKTFQSYMDRLAEARDGVLSKIDGMCSEYKQREAEVEAAIIEVNRRIEDTKLKYEHQKTSEISKMLEYITTDINIEVKMIVDEIVGKVKKQPKLADFKKVQYAKVVKKALKDLHMSYWQLKDEESESLCNPAKPREKPARPCKDCEEKTVQLYQTIYDEYKLLQLQREKLQSSEEEPSAGESCKSINLLKRSPNCFKKN